MNVIKVKHLKTPALSSQGMRDLQDSLTAFSGPDDLHATILRTENWPGREATHLVYSVGLRTIRELKELDESRLGPLSWRFFADGDTTMTNATVCWATAEHPGLPVKVMSVIQGPAIADILTSTELLNDLREVSDHPDHEYEVRVLRIPALYIEAFWLKSLSAERGDLIVPYGLALDGRDLIKFSAKGRLNRNRAYPVAEFLRIVGSAKLPRLASADLRSLALRTEDRRRPVEPAEHPSSNSPRTGNPFSLMGVYSDRGRESEATLAAETRASAGK